MESQTAGLASRTYLGLGLVTMATLMYEILLTRIFSVTMLYHYAFMAISIAMFGLTVGGLWIYLAPPREPRRTVWLASLIFALAIPFSYIIHAASFRMFADGNWRLVGLCFTYIACAIPFVFSGVAVSQLLAANGAAAGRVYAADLAGAALGCLALAGVLGLTDGMTAVFATAAVAAWGAWCLGRDFAEDRALGRRVLLALTLLAVGYFPFKTWVLPRAIAPRATEKGEPLLFEKWNSYSRVIVFGDPAQDKLPFGWGFSTKAPTTTAPELWLTIDAHAGTPLERFDGDLSKLDYLKYDVVNAAHALRQGADVVVVGSGGGRDILSALAFKQNSVTGIEVNKSVYDAVTGPFAEFTGRLSTQPGVTLVNDEARSYLTRHPTPADILQVSLIDTWAATAAGAFVLSENSLYTQEGWRVFMDQLKPGGILTFSRWYYRDRPSEIYRLVALAAATLKGYGVQDPRGHIMIVRQMTESGAKDMPEGIGTILVSREKFTADDVAKLRAFADGMGFEVALDPGRSIDPNLEILAGPDAAAFIRDYPLDISAPTDDRPFFFQTLRLRDAFRGNPGTENEGLHVSAVAVLATLGLTVAGLTLVCILLPLWLTRSRRKVRGALPSVAYFMAIGIGYMLVEVSFMQRLTLFLGHPAYSLTVVLATLLVASGLGSLCANRLMEQGGKRAPVLALVLLAVVLWAMGAIPWQSLAGLGTPWRIAMAIAALLPAGWLMGLAFPSGVKAATERDPGLVPWLWGVNGAASVLASVAAVMISMAWGIQTALGVGIAAYALAAACSLGLARRPTT